MPEIVEKTLTLQGDSWSIVESKHRELLVEGPVRTSKAQPLSSIVYTPNGPKTMGQVTVGDLVCTPDGNFAEVLEVHPQGKIQIYKITFNNGETVRCCKDHLWYVQDQDRMKKKYKTPFRVHSTEYMLDKFQKKNRGVGQRFQIMPTQTVYFETKPVELDPYLLGLILGDGCTRGKSISVSTADEEIVSYLKSLPNCKATKNGQYDYKLSKLAGSITNPYIQSIKKLGLMGKLSQDKFIPNEYKYNSVSVRLAVLQGLMDTDGHVSNGISGYTGKNSPRAAFSSTSKQLALDVKEIIESFGGVVTMSQHESYLYGVRHNDVYTLYIRFEHADKLFRLTRKKNKYINGMEAVQNTPKWIIKSIEPDGIEDAQCILIDHPDHLYLTNGFIPTHNTYSILAKCHVLASKYPNTRILWLRKTKSSLADSILETFESNILPAGHYLVLDGPARTNRQSYKYRNGSEIVCGGLDKPEKYLSGEYDIIYIAEAAEVNHADYKLLLTRLSCDHIKNADGSSWQQIIIDTNPKYPSHWINVYFNQPYANKKRIFINYSCNPKLFDDKLKDYTGFGKQYIDSLKETLTGTDYNRLFLGHWCQGDNLVYPEFKQEVHVIEPLQDAVFDRIEVGQDFGWTAGACVVVGFLRDAAYVVETHINAKLQLDDWIGILRDIKSRWGLNRIIADSAEPRSIDYIASANLPIIPCKKGPDSIRTGVSLIKSRLNTSGLFIYNNACKSHCPILSYQKKPMTLQEEFYSYEMDMEKEQPIPKDNHLLDSLRYVIGDDSQCVFTFTMSECGEEDDDTFGDSGWTECVLNKRV